MMSDKLTSERNKPRARSSELAGSCCDGVPVRPMLGWIVTTLFGLLALPGLGWTQTTLRTPSADEPRCLERDCPAARGYEGNSDPTTGNARNQAGAAPRPAKAMSNDAFSDNNRNNDEQDHNAEPAQDPMRGFPLKTDAVPEPPPNEFQEFVASSVGRRLPIYGHSLFDRVPTTFAPVDRIPVTDDYLIGPGDEILIRAWGQIDLDGKLVVDREGEVFLPKVGTR